MPFPAQGYSESTSEASAARELVLWHLGFLAGLGWAGTYIRNKLQSTMQNRTDFPAEAVLSLSPSPAWWQLPGIIQKAVK